MPSLEKQAWFQLGVVGSTVLLWLLLFGVFGSAEVSMAAFALLALTALQSPNQVRAFLDQRDRAIAELALNIAVRCWFVLSAILPIVAGSIWDWDRTVSFGTVAQGAWLAWLVVLMVRSVTTIYMYRSARDHA